MHRNTGLRTVGRADRGQSVFDYSIGISIFLVVVLGVLLFVPTAFGALNDDTGVTPSDRVAAERAADYLAESALVEHTQGGRANVGCLLAFFDDGTGCGFQSGNALSLDAGLTATQRVNVTIEADISAVSSGRETLCWDDTGTASSPPGFVTVNSGQCDTPFAAGPSVVNNENYVTATRTIDLGGQEVYLFVRAW